MATNNAGAPGGLIYEPRSVWSVTAIDTTPFADFGGDGASPFQYIRAAFNRDDLRNGSKDPITVTRFAVMALNYIYTQVPDSFADVDNNVLDAGAFAINQMRIRLGVPFRQQYSYFDINIPSYGPAPTWGEPADTLTPRANTFGLCRLNYEKPLYLPRTGGIEAQLSSPSDVTYNGPPAVPNVFSSNGVTQVPAEIAYLEEGGLWPGSARSKRFQVPLSQDPNQRPGQNGYPYGLPPHFAPATVNNGVSFWHRPNTFSAGEFRKQEATRAGSTKALGMSIALDQNDYDSALIAQFGATGKIAPLSTRIGSRVRCVDYGSGADWWRPGAPVALTFDTITPALVIRLAQPITLQPGDAFDVQIQVPGPQYFIGFEAQPDPTLIQNASSYQLGISFNGYTAIKG